ncbi:tRNA synthetases class I (K) [Abditibacterium utsteinense]|uniref:tRNA synthetases class I (K) n=1 Tax=Abditibacterium utsteinense TaxID=1960156 RepID=A0A2S8SR68_9BACT|nr:hypothetical protein [Abditibacterium utsteinense]PQV63290.1 tRNA synthetases class I (K) [Abditibacterium utsteinense]
MQINNLYHNAVAHFSNQPIVTIATGATCAFAGDERSIREHLISDEAARHLRNAGHTVIHLFIDDNLDPLNLRQLRVAVNKDESLIERCKAWCGRPIAHLPDPWGCCESYAAHFEEQVLNRLHYVHCHPTLVRVSKLYERGLYAPAVRFVLENPQKIRDFLQERFPQYTPEKLFWPICPVCDYIDSTRVESVQNGEVQVVCSRCEKTSAQPLDSLTGKLNWKLDCAVRWSFLRIDAEAFSQPFMEPTAGSFPVAQALSQEFFGGHSIFPLNYGLVKMENKMGGKLLDALPPQMLRNIFVDQPVSDINVSRDLLVLTASRHKVLPEFTYLEFIKRILPIWLLTPQDLTWEQRELVKHGIAFGKEFLQTPVQPHLPQRQHIEETDVDVLGDLLTLLKSAVSLREEPIEAPAHSPLGDSEGELELQKQIEDQIAAMGSSKKMALRRFRAIVGQEHGLPVSKLLLLLPLEYLNLLLYLIELFLKCSTPALAEIH